MKQKNPILGAVLGLFILGLYYSTGFNKRALFIVAGLIIASYAIMFLISTSLPRNTMKALPVWKREQWPKKALLKQYKFCLSERRF